MMTQVSSSLPLAGDYLVATFADMMHSPRFRKHVWANMHLTERRRLESLRLQTLYGDAPENANQHTEESTVTSPSTVSHTPPEALKAASVTDTAEEEAKPTMPTTNSADASAEKDTSKQTEEDRTPAAVMTAPSTPVAPAAPRWFDIAGRARYSAWVALRGRMSPDVAAECFCAEFLGFIKKYPHPALLPRVEAALSTAQGLALRTRGSNSNSSRHGFDGTRVTAPLPFAALPAAPSAATSPVLQVRALQGDPAALALLWVCRAYRIPCEFTVEPLTKALGVAQSGHGKSKRPSAPVSLSVARPAAALTDAVASANPYLPYTMADACYPFTASLLFPAGVPAAAAGVDDTAVTTPEAAFVLVADTFLAPYKHWMNVSGDDGLNGSGIPVQQLVQRCKWVDELQHITRHVRTPILALLVHQATQAPHSGGGAPAGRADLLRAVAAHLHVYEKWTMDRILTRRVHQAQSLLPPLLASTAVIDALQHAYAPDRKAVSAADVYVASCGYTLCTHPFGADVFPLLRVPTSVALSEPDNGQVVRAAWPSSEASTSPSLLTSPTNKGVTQGKSTVTGAEEKCKMAAAAAAAAPTYVPWGLPLYLSGVSAEYNDTINRLLRRETRGALQQAQRQQPIRLFINDTAGINALSHSKADNGTATTSTALRSAGYYEVSGASATKEAAEAVQQLMLTRLCSLRNDDLDRHDIVGSTSSLSGVPFLVLGHVFALTWALAQEQVPAFPYFMVDGNPDHFGGFSFLPERATDVELESKAVVSMETGPLEGGVTGVGVTAQRAQQPFQLPLAPAATAVRSSHTHADPASLMTPAEVNGASSVLSASSQDGGVSVESRLRAGWQALRGSVAKGVRQRLTGTKRRSGTDAAAGASAAAGSAVGSQNTGVNATHVLCSGGGGVGSAAESNSSHTRGAARL